MKQYAIPMALLVLSLLLVVFSESSRPKHVDWSPGYRGDETKPLGSYILRDQLGDLFPDQEITDVDQTLYEALFDSERTIEPGSNYILITDELSLSVLDTRSFLEFIREGGQALIAASSITGPLADSLVLETEQTFALQQVGGPEQGEIGEHPEKPAFRITTPSAGEDRTYSIRIPRSGWDGARHFILFDEDMTRIVETTAEELPIGVEQTDRARLITTLRIELDAGEIILTSLPETFSNVTLLEEEGLKRASVLLSYLPTAPIYWDEYYKPSGRMEGGSGGSGSPMSYIMSRPALYTAWLLVLGGLLLFIIFAARRRQRIIPVVDPPRNVTLDFIETVGNLYHDQGSFTDLAVRRTTSLLEYIRENLSLQTGTIDDLFVRRLSERSGVAPERIAQLTSWIARARHGTTFEAPDLLAYNREIEHFYANTER